MAGSGAPQNALLDGSELRVAIIAASWHEKLIDALIDGAQRALADAGVADVTLVRVPGTFELPVVASAIVENGLHRSAKASKTGDGDLPTGKLDNVINQIDRQVTSLQNWVKKPPVDALVALGVVIRGGTPHFEYVCEAATMGLTQVSVRYGIPIGFGVLTCDNEEQAWERSGAPGSSEDKGYEAAHAAIATALTLKSLGA